MLKRFWIVFIGAWLTMVAFVVLVMAAESTLDAPHNDRGAQPLTPEQQKRLHDKLWEEFDLYATCNPLLLSASLSDTENILELSKTDIQNAAESRLRAARIYSDEQNYPAPYLRIGAHVVGKAFSVHLFLEKFLFDRTHSRLPGYATTYMDGHLGTHGGSGDYVLSSISQLLDRFIANYLRVNEKVCQ